MKLAKSLILFGLAVSTVTSLMPEALADTESASPASSQADDSSAATTESKTIWSIPKYEVKVKQSSTQGQSKSDNSKTAASANAASTSTTAATGDGDGSTTATTTSTASTTTVKAKDDDDDDDEKPRRRRRRRGKHTESAVKPKQSDYDAAAAKAFEASNAPKTQYVWSRQSAPGTPYAKTTAQELDDFNRELSDKIGGNLQVPSTATLVETTNKKYLYIMSFTLLKSGQVANFQVLPQAGNLTTVPLADNNENNAVVGALQTAIRRSCPIKSPPSGIPPWNMLAVYDMSTGKIFTTFNVR